MSDPRLSEATAAELAEAFAARVELDPTLAWDVRFRVESGRRFRSGVALVAIAPGARRTFTRAELNRRPDPSQAHSI